MAQPKPTTDLQTVLNTEIKWESPSPPTPPRSNTFLAPGSGISVRSPNSDGVQYLRHSSRADIYFHQGNSEEHHYALELRDAVLRLRRDGAFIAVPLFRVNEAPIGPHPVGSYEIWVPSETFASVYSYLCLNRGPLSILVHPLTREQVRSRTTSSVAFVLTMIEHLISAFSDHEVRASWIGPAYPLDLSTLPIRSAEIPLQYPTLSALISPSFRIADLITLPFSTRGWIFFQDPVYQP
ncbi:hypothetical protein MIND_00012100 [Mycena indigotica]|uniref:Uncharacterized protein n=1 Tax=Mycena indigotica TaxID=2126181 RepID=A0A8H6TFU4_9AGAR|nr:uncharacterized protein MIND_00012100 [Mycena indigotica]KAF7314980.1 hypothetical protein MIND_00012100 [Mycena indigotica]